MPLKTTLTRTAWIGPNSFRWLNINWDVFFKICAPDGLVQTPTLNQETLHKYLYQAGGVAVQKPHSYMELEPCTGTTSKCCQNPFQYFNGLSSNTIWNKFVVHYLWQSY